ncbi:glycosyltransferase family 4 protein [Vibrio salinus]|uniref:glycosyltransferase family 4 protein n=1 Tax=Vibrio salinus TaxID=2899784 RepID=UPI001E4D0A6A|nr:glycosyltransferase family 4 protein [Vibrio salinus]MCE0493301.1 glycosyltransferase family 4 protein [Vibrio salinus]
MKIIVLGTGQQGGIDSVIKNIEVNASENHTFKRFITHSGKGKTKDLFLSVWGVFIVLFYSLFFSNICFHLHMSYRGSFWRKYVYLKIAKAFSKKVIIHLHGSEFKKFYRSQTDSVQNKIRKLISGCDYFVVLSNSWQAYIESIFDGKKQDNVLVIPNFAVIEPIPDIKKQPMQLLFLGALIERKGIFDLLKVLKEMPDVTLNVGGGGDVDAFWKAVDEQGVREQIQFHGWVDKTRKAELMAQSQLLILPSYNEGLPVVILEAMASCLPVISTPVGGIPEVIIDDNTGFIVTPGDVDCIKQVVDKALHNADLTLISSNAKALYDAEYDVSAIIPKIEFIYN